MHYIYHYSNSPESLLYSTYILSRQIVTHIYIHHLDVHFRRFVPVAYKNSAEYLAPNEPQNHISSILQSVIRKCQVLLLFCILSQFVKHQHSQLLLASDGRNMTMCQRADVSKGKLYLFSKINSRRKAP